MVKTARIIPPNVRDTQARASDPAASSFVSANWPWDSRRSG